MRGFQSSPAPQLVAAILGFFVSIGIVFYDQRNTQLYDALVDKGIEIEKDLRISGPFSERQPKSLKLFGLFAIWHNRGLALIYGSILGSWLFPIACSIQLLYNKNAKNVQEISASITLIALMAFISELHFLQKRVNYK